MSFLIKPVKKFGLTYYAVYSGAQLITTHMSKEAAIFYCKRMHQRAVRAGE